MLYSFGTSPNDGIMPLSSLIQGNDGNFYGTTSSGGTIGGGALIKVTPGGIESVLYSFGGFGAPDGSVPEGNLIQANDGNFYTITGFGGANKAGAVVKITPAGTASVLYSNAVPGDGPIGGLIQASDGNLYGMTNLGGANGTGAVIKITLAGVESVLHSFGATGSGDGVGPNGGLIQASDGNLYGLTLGGGAYSDGAVIKITPAGAESVLYSFGPHAADGYDPLFSLVQASDGNLYAVTLGGAHSVGAVVKITLAGTGSVLYSFGSQPGDGYASVGSLIQASDGNLYGLTNQGGANFFGTAFRVTLAGTETVLYAFSTASNGGSDPQVQGSLIQASDGNLYGMTTFGGVTGADGAVIKFTW